MNVHCVVVRRGVRVAIACAVALGGCAHPPPKSIDIGGTSVGIGTIDVWSQERPTEAEKRRGGGVPGSD
jgi:hypothetical protein